MPASENIKNTNSIGQSQKYNTFGPLDRNKKMRVGLKNNTFDWLKQNHIEQPQSFDGSRVFATGGSDGLDGFTFEDTMKAINLARGKSNRRRNAGLTGVESFSIAELDPTNPDNWERSVRFTEEVLEKFQEKYAQKYNNGKPVHFIYSTVAHIDGKNHNIHNHWVMDKIDTLSGKTMKTKWGDTVNLIRESTDEVAQEKQWANRMKVIEKPKTLLPLSDNERKMTKLGKYVRNNEYRLALDKAMANPDNHSFGDIVEEINKGGRFNIKIRGQKTASITFAKGIDDLGEAVKRPKRLNGLSGRSGEYDIATIKQQMKLPASQRDASKRLKEWRDTYEKYPRINESITTIQQASRTIQSASQKIPETGRELSESLETIQGRNRDSGISRLHSSLSNGARTRTAPTTTADLSEEMKHHIDESRKKHNEIQSDIAHRQGKKIAKDIDAKKQQALQEFLRQNGLDR